MRDQMLPILLFSLACFILPLNGEHEPLYPPGATDLVPNQRLEEFKLENSPTLSFRWKAGDIGKWKTGDIDWDKVEIEGLDTYQIAYPSTILELRLQNEMMKTEISELKLRLSKLEKVLNQKSEPYEGDNSE